MKTIPVLSLFACFLAAGCTSPDTRIIADSHLESVRHVFVQHNPPDGRGIDQLIARELQHLGYDASAGPLTLTPADTDVIVSYNDEWTFDFTTYMIKLELRVRGARNAKNLAATVFSRPSITGHSPEAMIHAAVAQIFRPRVPPVPLETHPEAP